MTDVINIMDENNNEEKGTEAEFVNPEAPKVTKIKSCVLSNSITVEESIFALYYVDHGFYGFRDEGAKKISATHTRNSGGAGLI